MSKERKKVLKKKLSVKMVSGYLQRWVGEGELVLKMGQEPNIQKVRPKTERLEERVGKAPQQSERGRRRRRRRRRRWMGQWC